jgi:hypothetical protein
VEIESLDILIGIVTIYLTFALACTAIVEAISAWLSVRSHTLEKILKEVFAGDLGTDKPFSQAFYAHPLIQSLSQGDKGRPSYIPPAIVGQTVLSLITSDDPSKSLTAAINNLPGTTNSNRVKGLLTTLAVQVSEDTTAFRKAVETHFDAAMDRASGWTKRSHQKVAFIASALLVAVANVDTITLMKQLSSNPEIREKMLAVAEELLKNQPETPASATGAKTGIKSDGPPALGSKDQATSVPPKDNGMPITEAVDSSDKTLDNAMRESTKASEAITEAKALLKSSGLQFGWKEETMPEKPGEWCAKFVGLVVSTFAISLGAPFWFDLLQRFMRVRSAGISPREKKS